MYVCMYVCSMYITERPVDKGIAMLTRDIRKYLRYVMLHLEHRGTPILD